MCTIPGGVKNFFVKGAMIVMKAEMAENVYKLIGSPILCGASSVDTTDDGGEETHGSSAAGRQNILR